MSRCAGFATRLRDGAALAGLFQKLAHYQATELIGLSALDFALIDAEHAPFDLVTIDACMLAARAHDLPLLVRVPSATCDLVAAVLDMGAAGLFVPHVTCAGDARTAVEQATYVGGRRGFSPSSRAGYYGTRDWSAHIAASDRDTAIIVQIEDASALERLDEIAATPGVHGLFVGSADLALSMCTGWTDPALDEALATVAAAARRHGKASGAHISDPIDIVRLSAAGLSFFTLGTDQALLRTGADRLARAMSDSTS